MVVKLTSLKIKSLTEPGRYCDGGGLWLQVQDIKRNGSGQSWQFRYQRGGVARTMGLGGSPLVSLAEARQLAEQCRKLLNDGIDPIDRRKSERLHAKILENTTFRKVAEMFIDDIKGRWRNPRTITNWQSILRLHVYPAIGDEPINNITARRVAHVLTAISTKHATQADARQIIESVVEYAKAHEWFFGDNPASHKRLANLIPHETNGRVVNHHSAVPWKEIGSFMIDLRTKDVISARILEFQILTAARPSEAGLTIWGDIDLAATIWTIPADRMKSGRPHRVPLSPDAVSILKEMEVPGRTSPAGEHVFPWRSCRKSYANGRSSTCRGLLNKMGVTATPHGFRSTFRDWVAEATSYQGEVAEMCLAHQVGSRTEQAYFRTDLFGRRRRLLEEWAEFCSRPYQPATNVVSIRAEG